MSQPIHLFSLPTDVLHAILDHTPYHSLHALRLTHRTFATLITPTALKTSRSALSSHLRNCERTGAPYPTNLASYFKPANPRTVPLGSSRPTFDNVPFNNDPRPCYTCLLPLPPSHFTLRLLVTFPRICIDCAVTTGRWPPGTRTAGHIVCAVCGGFKPYTDRIGELSRDRGPESGNMVKPSLRRVACNDCFEVMMQRAALGEGNLDEGLSQGSQNDEAQLRSGRCQRCWAIDHTERPVHREVQGRPLCEGCFAFVAAES